MAFRDYVQDFVTSGTTAIASFQVEVLQRLRKHVLPMQREFASSWFPHHNIPSYTSLAVSISLTEDGITMLLRHRTATTSLPATSSCCRWRNVPWKDTNMTPWKTSKEPRQRCLKRSQERTSKMPINSKKITGLAVFILMDFFFNDIRYTERLFQAECVLHAVSILPGQTLCITAKCFGMLSSHEHILCNWNFYCIFLTSCAHHYSIQLHIYDKKKNFLLEHFPTRDETFNVANCKTLWSLQKLFWIWKPQRALKGPCTLNVSKHIMGATSHMNFQAYYNSSKMRW